MGNRLVELHKTAGQSAWLDNLQRSYLTTGYLEELISKGVRGLTSNPTIFQKAIQSSIDYDEQFFQELKTGITPEEIYWKLVISDIVLASQLFRDTYTTSGKVDGFVSVEVDPRLAHDASKTIDEARGLRKLVNSPNVMIKIPATKEGLTAITQMVSEGCPVNVTLIFSLGRYEQVIDAFLEGLEIRGSNNQPLDDVQSVASFFISRIDAEVDAILVNYNTPAALALVGTTAINQARLAYQIFLERFSSPRWASLEAKGASVQRPLWASTSTKNPSFSDTLYVDELIGSRSVNTLPESTMHSFIDHGKVETTITSNLTAAVQQWQSLASFGVDMEKISDKLETDGVASFIDSFEDLLNSLRLKAGLNG